MTKYSSGEGIFLFGDQFTERGHNSSNSIRT